MGKFNQGYPNLYDDGGGEESGEGRQTGSGFNEQWGWFVILDSLSNGDGAKWNYFLEMKVVEFLNRISYYKSKQEYERMMIKMNGRGK